MNTLRALQVDTGNNSAQKWVLTNLTVVLAETKKFGFVLVELNEEFERNSDIHLIGFDALSAAIVGEALNEIIEMDVEFDVNIIVNQALETETH